MSALKPGKRKQTARELAELYGVNERTIRRAVAQPRDEYLGEAERRRQTIRAMRSQGMTMRAIAAELGVSVGTVHYSLNRD
jgi:transposase